MTEIKLTQHVPNFISGIEPFEITGNSLEDLLDNKWIKSWQADKDFYRYSLSIDKGNYPEPITIYRLMAEFKEGKSWWVLGYLNEPVDLPKFEPMYENPELLK